MGSEAHNRVSGIASLASLPTEVADEFTDWHWDPSRRGNGAEATVMPDRTEQQSVANSKDAATAVGVGVHERSNDSSACAKGGASVLSAAQRHFLRTVIEHPGKPSSAYAKLAGRGTHQAIALRKRLVRDGYLREHRVNTSKRGRVAIVLEPLPTALAAIGG